jgi:hypothetical protein
MVSFLNSCIAGTGGWMGCYTYEQVEAVRAYLAGIRASGRKTHLFHAMFI